MLRPAASPWKNLSHRTWPATVAARSRPVAARCINITATSSSTEPELQQQHSIDGATTPVAPAGKRRACWIGCVEAHVTRRPLRSHRHALFSSLRLALGLANPLHAPWNSSRPQWKGREYALDPLLPRTLSARACWHSLLVPKSLFHEPCHSSSLDQITNLKHSLSQPGWPTGLGH